MTTNHFGDLVLTNEEYKILKETLNKIGVNLIWSSSDSKTYECYVTNPYKQVVEGWGNDLQKSLATDFYERNNK